MGKEILTFDDIEIEKYKFYRQKGNIFLEDVDIKIVLVCNRISSGEKNCSYFITYLYDDYKFKPSYIVLPKTTAYVKRYNGQTK